MSDPFTRCTSSSLRWGPSSTPPSRNWCNSSMSSALSGGAEVPDNNDTPERPMKKFTAVPPPGPGPAPEPPATATCAGEKPQPEDLEQETTEPPQEDIVELPITGRKFWAAAFERALRTYLQVVLALIGVGYVSIADLDWKYILLAAATAAVASLIFSILTAMCREDRNPAVYEIPVIKTYRQFDGR